MLRRGMMHWRYHISCQLSGDENFPRVGKWKQNNLFLAQLDSSGSSKLKLLTPMSSMMYSCVNWNRKLNLRTHSLRRFRLQPLMTIRWIIITLSHSNHHGGSKFFFYLASGPFLICFFLIFQDRGHVIELRNIFLSHIGERIKYTYWITRSKKLKRKLPTTVSNLSISYVKNIRLINKLFSYFSHQKIGAGSGGFEIG